MMSGIGRFGSKPGDTKSIKLQAPLDRIVASGIADLRVSHYYFDEPLFDEYELTTVRATWDFSAAESIVRDGHNILDLGCGDGRLLLHLAEKFSLKESFGIDISPVAIDRFNASIHHSHVHALQGDIFDLPAPITQRRFDVVTFGDATVNFILDDDKLEVLLRSAKAQLRDAGSRIMVAVFGDGTPERLSFMDKRCTVVPFRRSNGEAALIWWAYKYDSDKLIMHRSVFAQSGRNENGNIEGVVCDLQDRMWTPSALVPIAEASGLTVDKVIASEVQDGTAVGMATAIVILKSA
ncbi:MULTISPECIES: trans-aconitate 2-methyltransferase [Ralstonia solanacearum species complex]|nr:MULTISPECIES: class I SAM-dependent methyltransferase [Ralstonia]QLR12047.1 methyltransferase domain-containing protein [Ralstonia solanacearum]MDO3516818.1 methyltransferase domain-containing protein [Ralstonia pseudosolanacearum]MDO3527212.1 methyltransferase domain-containing protein [Ralstonia pseudosolanacearum]MDO3532611.1 methyltransferase domain-containing protein [Ralstonia pseudosolanacearum]MDO3543295.1 methyltransferase domain-containing protein [Ralstonia pseudosolanacearum]